MISTPDFQDLGQRLLEAMDCEILLLGEKHREMERLLAVITSRDNAALEKLLPAMEQAQREQDQLDRQMEHLTAQLAMEAGCGGENVKLSKLVRRLPRELARPLEDRRQALTGALRRLRRKHMEVSFLLHECRKTNRMLLDCILRETAAPQTYGANGSLLRSARGGVMSAEL